jgi:hypothetical protein
MAEKWDVGRFTVKPERAKGPNEAYTARANDRDDTSVLAFVRRQNQSVQPPTGGRM